MSVYWFQMYTLITALVLVVAGLFIFICFIWCELNVWLRGNAHPTIGIPVAVPSPLANGGADND